MRRNEKKLISLLFFLCAEIAGCFEQFPFVIFFKFPYSEWNRFEWLETHNAQEPAV